MEVIAPFTELDCGEDPRPVHGRKRRFILRPEHTAPALDLHVRAAGITHDRPTHGGEIVEDRLRGWVWCWPGIKPIPELLILHHLDELFQRFELGGRAVDRKHKCALPGQELHLEIRGNGRGEINLRGKGAADESAAAKPR